ncbi:hypothetical protein HZB07_06450 [Candidatus Saganbacteria bacterium]|nr:hypothetical protein [Candidatus Saganbacteria bacterium]
MNRQTAAVIFCLFSLSLALWAEEIPVNLKADKLKFIEGTSIIEATGSVEVKFKEATIFADHLVMDSATNIATADGHVRLLDSQYKANAAALIYNIDNQKANFTDFRARTNPKRMRGPLFLTAASLNDQKKKLLGQKGSLSTCERTTPHYYLLADRVEYYPDDKVLGYNSTLYVGAVPVLWLPLLYYDLGQKEKRNWSFGHNETEGDYLKSTWGYPLGILYLDLMEKKGFGQGTQLNYDLLGLGAGALYLYHLDEQDTKLTDWVSRISHSKQITPWTKLNFNHRYTATYLIPYSRKDQTEFGLGLQYRDQARLDLNLNTFDDRQAFYKRYNLDLAQARGDTATNYNFNYEYLTKAPNWLRSSQRFSHHRLLWSGINFDTRANYYNNVAGEGMIGDQRLEPVVELSGRGKNFSWRINENWYLDLDGDAYTGDNNYQYLEKQPELEISPDALDLKIFRLQPRLKYGFYREVRFVPELAGNRNFSTQRYQAALDLDRSFSLGFGTILGMGAGLDQILYGPGDALYNYRESLRLQTDLGSSFRHEISYQKAISDGNSPFLFDQLGSRYHNASDRLIFYYLDRFRLTIDSGYNWQARQWSDVMGGLMLRPAKWLTWDASTGWSIEQRQYRDFINNLALTPFNFLTTRFSAVSDLNNGDLKAASFNHDLFILAGEPNQWHLIFNQILDTNTKEFKVRDIMAVKELHCWRLIYTYNDYRKEFSFTMSLNALPDEPVGVSSGRGFYFDTLEKSLRELKPEGAVQRY